MNMEELQEQQMSRLIAPEDIRAGMYLAVMHEVQERSFFFWEPPEDCGRKQPRHVLRLPSGSGRPLKVESVCLPFVIVRKPTTSGGSIHTLDVRRYRCAQLPEEFGRTVFAMFSETKQEPKAPCAEVPSEADAPAS